MFGARDLAFDMPSSFNLIISSFRFKVRDVLFFLSPEHLEPAVGLVIGLLSLLLCFRPKERGGDGGVASR